MNSHKKAMRWMLSMTALTLLLVTLMACDTGATPVPEATPVAEAAAVPAPASPAASVIEPSTQPQATAAGEITAPDPAPAFQDPVQARAEAPAPAPVATEEQLPRRPRSQQLHRRQSPPQSPRRPWLLQLRRH